MDRAHLLESTCHHLLDNIATLVKCAHLALGDATGFYTLCGIHTTRFLQHFTKNAMELRLRAVMAPDTEGDLTKLSRAERK